MSDIYRIIRILKYTPLFPIYYLIYPHEIKKIFISVGVMLAIIIIVMGLNQRETRFIRGGDGKDSNTYVLREYKEKIDVGLEEGLNKLKEEYYKKLEEEEKQKTKEVYEDAYSRLTSKPKDRDYEMAKDYLSAVQQASNLSGAPQWLIIGLSVLEGGPLYTDNPPVPGSCIPTHLYGVDGMDFKTYGYTQILEGLGDRASGVTDGAGVAGPFKFKQGSWESWGEDGNEDGIKDRYNLYDASIGAGNMLKGNKSNIDNITDLALEDSKWVWSAGAFNAGPGGMLARIPYDSIEEFLEYDLEELIRDTGTQASVYDKYIKNGRGWVMRKPIIEFWDSIGWKMDQTLRSKVLEKVPSIDITQPTGTPNPNGAWAGDLKGNRTVSGYKTSRSEYEVMSRENRDGNRISMNMESLEYLVAVVSIGKTLEKELNYKVLQQEENEYKPSEFKNKSKTGVNYYWQQDQEKILANKTDKLKIQGRLGEVGWKGDYPVFVQKPKSNKTSDLSWKFNGRQTTLGKSGCSLYALTTVIHGSGLGNQNIPGTDLQPTLENLSKVFPNGPIIFPEVSKKGYQTVVRQTKTKKDLDILFEEIKAGVPYIINTRYGEVKAVNSDGEEVSTLFTRGGHFIVAVSGYEVNGKRYIEVVQSSRSEAGTIENDQNTLSFDYDHMVNNKIIQSSQGYSVPAYTIVGIKEGVSSKFLKGDYKPPTTGNLEGINIKDKIEKPEMEGRMMNSKLNTEVVRQIEKLMVENGKLKPYKKITLAETALVSYHNDNILIYLDYNNALRITNLDDILIYEGVVKAETAIGTTTEDTNYSYMVRNENDQWIDIMEIIEVTED